MRTVVTVPETHDQDAGDARDQLRRSGTLRLFRDAAVRLRAAHGTTYARALGHSSLLTLIPGVIAYFQLRKTVERWREELTAEAASYTHYTK